ncbi:host specificity protein J [Psychrobacter sp. UBA3962]|uniref:host specificity protein J n=1 Tax=Psychrobacter sp. UBA3962 TaxID=1947352 RepID=UPI0025FE156C|nr:phage tail protein [Psychrobacter sp. UBA3962]
MQLIYGSKAGQKKPHTPRISDDTVASITKITALYLLGEGEIRGLVNGSKSIYFEDTPLEDENGHRNFENVEWEIRHGTVDQTHIPGVPSASTERVINTELRSSVPWTRLITDIELSSINVNVSWPRLSKMEDNGDVNGTTVDYAIDVRTDGGAWVTMVSKSLTAKTSGRYQRTHNIPLPDANNNWQVRVRKITEDGDNERLFNQMHIDSIAEIIDAKLCYPHSAVIKLTWDSRAFGNTPKVSFETYGRYVKVPVNYDAETRKSTGIWTGEFKEAFTTNPAWIYYDLITNDRYGLGNKLKPYMINKWAIEHIAKICDVMVDDGKGGLEPRYTCNLYLQTAETAFDVLQHIAGIFRGMAFWNGSQIILDADTYKDCDYVITRANVINGEFVKTGTAANERHTIAKVGYSNPDNNYEVDYVFVRNERAIAEIGINILDLSAIACTSEGEAYRFGLAALLTEQNRTQTVSFTMGLDGALPSVGDRIDIPDIMFTGHNTGGRISSVNKDRTVITVDRDNVPVSPGDKLVVNLESGKAQTRETLSINGREITVSKPFDAVSRENVWAVSSDELPTMSFIVLSVRANEDGTQYSYTALQYDATLQQQIDNGTIIENKPPLPPLVSMIIDAPQSIALSTRHRIEQAQTITTLVITWEQVKDAVAYDVEWRKDDGDWISVPRTGNISVEVDGVYSGNYIARVRAVSAFDAVSKPITSTLTKVEGKAGKPPSLLSLKATGTLFGMELNWSFAKGSGDAAYTEIQVASAPDTNVALLGQYSYPTNNAKLNGLQNGLVQYYRGRIVDKLGFKGDWSNWVKGQVLNDSSQVLDLIAGDIEQSHLHQELGEKIDKIDIVDDKVSQETRDRIQAIIDAESKIDKKANQADFIQFQEDTSNEFGVQGEKLEGVIADYRPRHADKNRHADKSRSAQWTYWKTVARDNYATNERITVLQSDVADSNATYTQSLKTLATSTEALASKTDTLQTTVSGNTASIQQHSKSINGLSAEHTLTLDVNGYVTGVGNYNDGKKGSFAIRVDEFWIASPDNKSKVRPLVYYPSSTTINGVVVPNGLYLDGNIFAKGSITADKIHAESLSALTANIGHFKSAPSGARLEIKDSVLEVYDSNNRLRVRMGVW